EKTHSETSHSEQAIHRQAIQSKPFRASHSEQAIQSKPFIASHSEQAIQRKPIQRRSHMELFYRKYGEPAPPLVIVHGLYGSSDNWVSIARDLSDRFEVFVVDQRNHGHSPHSPVHDYPAMREDLREFLDRLEIRKAVLIGHSMGGKTVMSFAEAWPQRVQALVSVDIAPKSYRNLALASRTAANHSNMIEAMMSLDLSRIQSREEADQALAGSIGSERIRSFLLKNLRRENGGAFSWQINLEAISGNLEAIFEGMDQEAIAARGGITGFPALFISGGDSEYIRVTDHQLIRDIFPTAEVVTIPGAGHWVHAEKPALLVKTLRYFLDI
ncbi:MAG: alpha/beta fold hydrolase, partial [Bacteroidales bacterium]|nr:alpha/beta fold hydrolase [Bacteroidales bacterium]